MNEMFSMGRYLLTRDANGGGGGGTSDDDAAKKAAAAKAAADAKAKADADAAAAAAAAAAGGEDEDDADEDEKDEATKEFEAWLGKQPKATQDKFNKMPAADQAFFIEQTTGLRSGLHKERGLSKEARDRLKALETAETERKKKAMTDLERAQTDLKEAQDQVTATAAALKKNRIESAVLFEAAKLRFVSPEDAMSLLDQTKLTITEDGTVKGIEKALQELVKSKPYLVEKANGSALGNAIDRNKGKKTDVPAKKPIVNF